MNGWMNKIKNLSRGLGDVYKRQILPYHIISRWMEGGMDGWDGWMGWMGWMDGWMDVLQNYCSAAARACIFLRNTHFLKKVHFLKKNEKNVFMKNMILL